MKNRKKITKNRSGGIMVGFKDNLAKHIDIVYTDSTYVMWFRCSEQLFKTDQPVFFGVVYIPPEYTKYSSEDAFSELQHVLIPQQFKHTIRNKLSLLFTLLYTELFERDATSS
jgi:hypothetical protein